MPARAVTARAPCATSGPLTGRPPDPVETGGALSSGRDVFRPGLDTRRPIARRAIVEALPWQRALAVRVPARGRCVGVVVGAMVAALLDRRVPPVHGASLARRQSGRLVDGARA